MSSSEELLALPPPRRRPVLRAVVAVVAVGLVAWGATDKLSEPDEPRAPAAAPPPPEPSSRAPQQRRVSIPPHPGRPTPLEGRWVGDGSSGRITLVISGSRLTLRAGTDGGSPGLRRITVSGHRLHVRPSGDEGEVATYGWRIRHDRLEFELLERTPKAALRLESVTFRRT